MSSMSWNPYLFDINRQYLGQKLRLKMGHFTVSLPFMRVTPPWVFNAQERDLYHMKALMSWNP